MLIDSDSTFRQGFAACLEQDAELQVVLQADSSQTALQVLQRQSDINPASAIDVVILDLELRSGEPGQPAAITLCRSLRSRYPALPILVTSTAPEPGILGEAYRAGALGYCQKGTVLADFVQAIRQVAAGFSYWNQGMELIARSPGQAPSSSASKPLAVFRRNLRQSGLSQIDQAIAQLNAQLSQIDPTSLDALFLAGRRRELQAARWLVNRLLTPKNAPQPGSESAPAPSVAPPDTPLQTRSLPEPRAIPIPTTTLVSQPETVALRSVQATLFDSTIAKLQFNLRNLTDTPLEIDILRDDRKRELLTLVLRKLEDILDDLRFSQVELAQLPDKQAAILQDLWQTTTSDFFGRYYTLPLSRSPIDQVRQAPVELVEILLQDAAIVQAEILNKIPLVPDFLAHLLFQTPLTIEDTTCTLGSIESMARMEMLLQHLMIQVANGVVQPLLNRFGDVVTVKQNFYDRRLLSTREIERFRNNLSWKYRVERYFGEPTAIFESRYGLFTLQEGGIVKTSIYAPRNREMAELGGIPLAVTIALETRDAIAPRFRSAISFVGSGVVYVLTEVIGRGIGLIGRGILKGIGNVVQDARFSRR